MTDPRPAVAKPCVICGKAADPEHLPFCSPRCATIDLHRWLSGAYAVPDTAPAEASDEGDETTPASSATH